MKEETTKIINIETTIKEMIYVIRGQKVMLDYELAKIYEYETRDFNKQIKNNYQRFPDDFMFRLTNDEWKEILKWKKSTSSWGGRRKPPLVFTEQGIYMLMTVLRGELATKQSIAIIRAFKAMKDYVLENSPSTMALTNESCEKRFKNIDKRFEIVENKLEIVMENFSDKSTYKHTLILNGQRIEADIAYRNIYCLAKKSIIVIDDYINVKTLMHLKNSSKNIDLVIVSDNKAKDRITDIDVNDFVLDTKIKTTLIPSKEKFHDRYIIIDFKTENEKIFLSGSSSKDSGNKITTIVQIEKTEAYRPLLDDILNN